MVEQKQKQKYKTFKLADGREIKVEAKTLTREDIERELAEFEAKYGMSSEEFAGKWNRGEMDCAVMDYFDWAGDCKYMSRVHGIRELEIPDRGIAEEWEI